MPDLLDRIRKELDSRLRELSPLVREFERLQRATAALARTGARSVPRIRPRAGVPEQRSAETERARVPKPRPAASRAKAAQKPARSRAAAPRRKPTPRGQTQAKVLAALAAAPGSNGPAVAKASGISSNVAAATISRLVKQGRVRRLDGGGYALVEAADDHGSPTPVGSAEAPPEPASGAQSAEQSPSPGTA